MGNIEVSSCDFYVDGKGDIKRRRLIDFQATGAKDDVEPGPATGRRAKSPPGLYDFGRSSINPEFNLLLAQHRVRGRKPRRSRLLFCPNPDRAGPSD
jgi:hypothetical protein